MFSKLLKYEMRSSRRIAGLLCLVILGICLLLTGGIKLLTVTGANANEDVHGLLMATIIPLCVLGVLAIVACNVGIYISLLVQFYRTKFTDEGYLTFTLPAGAHSIFLSSLVNMAIWHILGALASVLSLVIVMLFGTSPDSLVNTELLRELAEAYSGITELISPAKLLETLQWTALDDALRVANWILQLLSSLVLAPACIVLGATVSRKYKVLASVGVYVLIRGVIRVVTTVLLFVFEINSLLGAAASSWLEANRASQAASLIINLVILLVGYFLSVHLMNKKLNLS